MLTVRESSSAVGLQDRHLEGRVTPLKGKLLRNVAIAAVVTGSVLLLSACEEDDTIGALGSNNVNASETATVLLPAGGVSALVAVSANGSIAVRGEAGLQTASVTMTKHSRGQTLKEAQDRLGRIRVQADLSGSELRAAYRATEQDDDVRRLSGVDFDILVPAGCRVSVDTSNGEVEVAAIRGTILLHSSNGAVDVRQCAGSLSAETSNGRIDVADFDGDVRADTSNGEVWIDGVTGAVDAETSNGGVHYAGRPPSNTANRLHTSNGSITASVPADASIRFEARVSSGRIRSALPLVGDTEGDEWAAALNPPADTDFSLRTSNGSIRIDALP